MPIHLTRSAMIVSTVLLLLGATACSGEEHTPSPGPAPDSTAATLAEYQTMADDVTVQLAACIEEHGIKVNPLDESMALTLDLSEETDDELVNKAIADCSGQHPYPAVPQLTDSQLHALHTRLIERANCLEKNGHPPIERPEADTFGTEMRAFLEDGVGEGWEPLDAAAVPTEIDIAELQSACPSPRLGDLPAA